MNITDGSIHPQDAVAPTANKLSREPKLEDGSTFELQGNIGSDRVSGTNTGSGLTADGITLSNGSPSRTLAVPLGKEGGESLRNANRQLRSEPANPQVKVSPWIQSTIEPDTNRKPLEIGGN